MAPTLKMQTSSGATASASARKAATSSSFRASSAARRRRGRPRPRSSATSGASFSPLRRPAKTVIAFAREPARDRGADVVAGADHGCGRVPAGLSHRASPGTARGRARRPRASQSRSKWASARGKRSRKRFVVERREPGLRERLAVHALGGEERELRGEHDVREGERVADEEARGRRERLIDPAEVRVAGAARALVRRRLDASASRASAGRPARRARRRGSRRGTRRCARRRRGRRRRTRRAPAEPRDRARDRVRFEDADDAVRAERGGHGAERMRGEERVGLVERVRRSRSCASRAVAARASARRRERARVEVPEPAAELAAASRRGSRA